jgi:TPR repeat protein
MAVKYYQLAVDQGYLAANVNLGEMYRTGDGVGSDVHKAYQLYAVAAKAGLADAQVRILPACMWFCYIAQNFAPVQANIAE